MDDENHIYWFGKSSWKERKQPRSDLYMNGTKQRSQSRYLAVAAALTVAALILLPPIASASQTRKMTFTCPLGGQKFESIGGIRRGREPTGIRLDWRPLGRYAMPAQPRQCRNGFVIYKDTFTPAELAKLNRIVMSAEYQALKKKHARNFLAAYLLERMGASTEELTRRYLLATWDTEGQWPPPDEDAKPSDADEALIRFYRQAALKSLDVSLADDSLTPAEQVTPLMRAAELERLLGNFDAAEKRLVGISAGSVKPGTFEAETVSQIKKYATMKDGAPHKFEGDIRDFPVQNQ